MMLYGLPGMDHAGIATQAKVDNKNYVKKDIDPRYDLG